METSPIILCVNKPRVRVCTKLRPHKVMIASKRRAKNDKPDPPQTFYPYHLPAHENRALAVEGSRARINTRAGKSIDCLFNTGPMAAPCEMVLGRRGGGFSCRAFCDGLSRKTWVIIRSEALVKTTRLATLLVWGTALSEAPLVFMDPTYFSKRVQALKLWSSKFSAAPQFNYYYR